MDSYSVTAAASLSLKVDCPAALHDPAKRSTPVVRPAVIQTAWWSAGGQCFVIRSNPSPGKRIPQQMLSRRADSNCRPAVYECVSCGAPLCQEVSFFANLSHNVSRFRRLCLGVVVKVVVSDWWPRNRLGTWSVRRCVSQRRPD